MSQKIALLTPLHPQKTGIADWIEEMLPYLRASLDKEYQIDLFVEDCVPTEADTVANHKIYPMELFESVCETYDLYVYQIGNNRFHTTIYQIAMRHPGIIILHDFAIHHLVAGIYLDVMKNDVAYFDEVERNHGEATKNLAYQRAANGQLGLWETDAISYPMNRTITKNAEGVIVFSQYAKRRLEQYGDAVPIHRAYLHCSGEAHMCSESEVKSARSALNLCMGPDEKLICVFGFIGKAKRPYSILKAAGNLKKMGQKFQLVFVGQLQDDCKDLPKEVKRAGLQDEVHMTGFTSAEEFDHYVRASDICISLRYPTMGETSGVLMRALRYGKPSVVTNIGTFRDVPDNTVIKISWGDSEVEELTRVLQDLLTRPELYVQMRDNAVAYAEEYLEPAKTAEDISEFLKSAITFRKIKNMETYITARDSLLQKYVTLGYFDKRMQASAAKTLAEIFECKYNS